MRAISAVLPADYGFSGDLGCAQLVADACEALTLPPTRLHVHIGLGSSPIPRSAPDPRGRFRTPLRGRHRPRAPRRYGSSHLPYRTRTRTVGPASSRATRTSI